MPSTSIYRIRTTDDGSWSKWNPYGGGDITEAQWVALGGNASTINRSAGASFSAGAWEQVSGASQGGPGPGYWGGKWQEFKTGVANDATMFQLWFGFLSGLGDKSKIYMNDRVAREMQQSAGITKATNDYYNKGITQGHYDFGVPGLKAAGFYPIQQFVGSYDYSISANLEGSFLQFTLTNTTSFASGALHIPPYSWNWNSGPMGNTYQTFIFTQPLRK